MWLIKYNYMVGFNLEKIPNLGLIYLLVAIVFLLISYPFFLTSGLEIVPFVFINLVIPFLAVYLAADHKRNLFVAIALAIPLGVISWVRFINPTETVIALQYVFGIIFYVFAFYVVLHQIIQKDVVTIDIIVGSIAAYLMIGLLWASIYALISLLVPESFALNGDVIQNHQSQTSFIYYSFVTLSNLGYRDITPFSHFSKSFSILESVSGVMFTAIVVGRVIGLYVAEKGHSVFEKVLK